MTKGNTAEKRAVRARMADTGETYTTALRAHRAQRAAAAEICVCGCLLNDGGCQCSMPCPCGPNCMYCDAELEDQ